MQAYPGSFVDEHRGEVDLSNAFALQSQRERERETERERLSERESRLVVTRVRHTHATLCLTRASVPLDFRTNLASVTQIWVLSSLGKSLGHYGTESK